MSRMGLTTGLMAILLAASAQPPTAKDILSAAIQTEQGRACGKATILVGPSGSEDGFPIGPDVPEDPANPTRLEVLWKGDALFRIQVWQDDALVRTITSDGAFIDTGNDTLWDISFLDFSSGASEDAEMDFYVLMWPHRVFRGFFFPLARGAEAFPYQAFYLNSNNRLYFESTPEPATEPQMSVARVVLALAPGLQWKSRIDTDHGHVVLSYEEILESQTIDGYKFTSPFQTPDGHWMPASFTYTLGYPGGTMAYTARLVQDAVSFIDQSTPPDFSLPKDEYAVVNRKNPLGIHVSEASDFFEDFLNNMEFPALTLLFIAIPVLLAMGYLLQFLLPISRNRQK